MRGLSGWRGRGVAVLLGLLASAALPPLYALPLLLIAIPGLIWRMDATTSWKGAFALGWFFGFGHFLGMIHWVGAALLVDAVRFGWMVPFAVGGLAALLGLFPALALALARPLWRPGWGRVLVMAGAWVFGEWIRTWGLSGFPWAPIGMVWMPFEAMVQGAAWVGVLGLSLLTMVVFGLPALIAEGEDDDKPMARRRLLAGLGLPLGLVGALLAAGTARLAGQDTAQAPLLRVRLVQPAIPQTMKWDRDRMAANLRLYIDMSRAPGLEDVDAVIWGETAVPYALDLIPEIRAALAEATPRAGALITGAPRRTPADEPLQIWNSLFVLDDQGRVSATYDKAHLVPFGEYVPFSDILPLAKITPGAVDFSPGPGLRTLRVGALPAFSPLICYEVIFPGAVVAKEGGTEGERPRWLLNLTNDGWYGRSTGPYQHFQIARLRAVEEGLALVRVANTGISGVFSPFGQTVGAIALGEDAILDVDVPQPLAAPPLFARLGNGLPLGMAAGLCALGLIFGRRHSRFQN
ncbi:apolipoprotein N-acyltransferase [Rhodospirillum rubrum]|uniref:apolipoprotein N-acyltransferase n=1 Tax=Rhodospirillum rubrum TaxID=1085 RepID=UPI0019057860|nr:apolipoprotein N-acyltransferase [Rhodospirillum rubrum]MBK1664670.1 apolipoprotein N-acyltransferase [Rhodospirillum rubrum]MBK1677767.1 apolipoprotein N-acyltransferase [Rhodospirillum rubrum]